MPYHQERALCCFTGQSVCWPALTQVPGSALSQLQAVEQVISALHVIQGLDGSDRGKRKIQQVGGLRGCPVNMALLHVLPNVFDLAASHASTPVCQLHTCFHSRRFSQATVQLTPLRACPVPPLQLHTNSNYFRRGLLELGFDVLGDWDSPVMVRALHAGRCA